MTSKLSRDRLQEIAEDGFLKHGESKELARMVLAATDSEPVALQPELAKVMYHFRDWNEGFPVERFKADYVISWMLANYPPAQPAKDREQVRRKHAEWSQATFGNVGPVGPLKHLSKEALEAAEQPGDLSEWADMQFLLWDAQRRAGITDEQITQAMIEKLAVNKQRKWPEPKDGEPRLHIKEQPAPVVMDDEKLRALFDAWFASDCSFDQSPEASEADNIAWRESYWYVWQRCRAAMLQAGDSPAQVADRPVAWHHTAKSKGENHSTCCFSYAPSHDFGPWYEKPQSQPHYLPERLDYDRALHFLSTEPRKLTEETLTAGITPIIPDGYVMVPMRLTAENGAKGALSGEFSETRFVNCPECFGDDECETCDGSGKIEITVPVTWTTIKEIWAKGVEHFSATPREVKGE